MADRKTTEAPWHEARLGFDITCEGYPSTVTYHVEFTLYFQLQENEEPSTATYQRKLTKYVETGFEPVTVTWRSLPKTHYDAITAALDSHIEDTVKEIVRGRIKL